MNLSGGRCFCLMLGVSLLAHGGLFLNRSPLARLSESKEAPRNASSTRADQCSVIQPAAPPACS